MRYIKDWVGNTADVYVYGDIVDEKYVEEDVDVATLKSELESLNGVSDINLYINSAGGSVFASSTMVSLLKRMRNEQGVKVHAYIDGLCASASTYLAMASDDINVYQNSLMMIHKPMTISIGNADDLAKDIRTLDTIENDMMIPLYMAKAKDDITEDEIRKLIADETWFSGNAEAENYIGNYFAVNLIDEARPFVASASAMKTLKNYKHIPEGLAETLKQVQNQPKDEIEEVIDDKVEKGVEEVAEILPEVADDKVEEVIDYTEFENIIKKLKGE